MRELDEIKADLAKAEKMLGIAVKQNAPETVMKQAESKVEKYKKELEEAGKSAEAKVEKAEDKVEKAEEKVEKAEEKAKEAKKEGDVAAEKAAKKEAKKAEKDAAKAAAVAEKAKEVSAKIEKAKGRGGKRPNAGRKASSIPKMPKEKKERGGKRPNAGRKKGSSPTKIVKPKNYVAGKDAPVFVKRAIVKKGKKLVPTKIEKVKKVRAFGQIVEYKNDSEFCSQLIKAFKKRKSVSKKLGKKKTRPVFGIITTKIKDAVTKAIDNTPKKDIEANPKAFLAKAERLEKSAIRFLEDFKAILGSDFKKSEITSEFGDLEKSIKQMISKYKK